MSKTNQSSIQQVFKEKKDDEPNLNMFYNLIDDNDRKIERPISAPPPGLTSNDQFFNPNTEGIDDRLYDYKYYVYYYSQKPLDPRLPKPLLHWDKNMTEGYYKQYVNVLLEKQKQKPKYHFKDDLAEEFEQKAKINEVNENSSEDNNYHDFLDDEIPDLDSNEVNNNPSVQTTKVSQTQEPPSNPFNFIAKPQPQPSYNPNNKPMTNTYQHFGYSQPPNNQFLGQNQNNNQRMPQMQPGNQQNFYVMGNNPMGNQMQGQMNPMNQMGQMNQIGQLGPMPNLNQMSPMNQLNYPMNSFPNNQSFNPYQQNINKTMPIRPNPQSFPNNNMNQQMLFNPYQNTPTFPPNMMPNNPMFMNNNMINNKPGFMFQGVPVVANQLNAPKMGIFEMCQDQNGSRQIQQQFEHGTDIEKENIYNSIQENILVLMKDVFGNYVVQKMFEKGEFKIKKQIHEKIKPYIIDLSLHMYGCRVVQKSLEVFRDNYAYQNDIIVELKCHVMKLIQDQNGNHVIQKCFETVPAAKLEFIVDEVISNIDNLAFHAFGCRVIQKILEYSNPQKIAPIMKKLMDNIIRLSECQFGNYIIQHIIEKGPILEKDKVLSTIKQGFVDLSVNKFASNVTEKAVMFCNEDYRKEILIILFKTSSNHEMGILRMMKNAFGNYVVQRLYEYCDDDTKNKIYAKINQPDILNELRKNNYGKHVLLFIEKNQLEKH